MECDFWDINALRSDLQTKIGNGWSYTRLAKHYGVNRYYLWNIATNPDYNPSPKVAARLGVVVLRPAPACPQCGDVHVYNEACGARQVTIVKAADPVAAPVVVVRQAAKPGKSRRRWKVDLPPGTDEAARRAVMSLTPEQRLAALLEAAGE